MTDKQLQDKYLGKRVKVVTVIDEKKVNVFGEVFFIGWNELLKSRWVTINRTPIKLNSYDQVSLV